MIFDLEKFIKKKLLKKINENLYEIFNKIDNNQKKTNQAFSLKWKKFISESKKKHFEKNLKFQKKWFLKLYGFDSQTNLKSFLESKKIIIDAGCGLGDKTAWIAKLSPQSVVIGIDNSDSIQIASRRFLDVKNLLFIKGDISNLIFLSKKSIDLLICDQVIMHTSNPLKTLNGFSKILKKNSYLICYWYSKKALPRELIDEYFRREVNSISEKDLWEFSKQLTLLGKELSKINKTIAIPHIPLLGIKKGKYSIQRFLYWNFLKCFWNNELGNHTSSIINFDWYSPKNAFRYDETEIKSFLKQCNFKIEFFNIEPNCYSGLFKLQK